MNEEWVSGNEENYLFGTCWVISTISNFHLHSFTDFPTTVEIGIILI